MSSSGLMFTIGGVTSHKYHIELSTYYHEATKCYLLSGNTRKLTFESQTNTIFGEPIKLAAVQVDGREPRLESIERMQRLFEIIAKAVKVNSVALEERVLTIKTEMECTK